MRLRRRLTENRGDTLRVATKDREKEGGRAKRER